LPQRKAITRKLAKRYQAASRAEKAAILEEVCELCDYNRDYARRALRRALAPPAKRKPARREPVYGPEVTEALRVVWAALDAPAGKRLAPVMAEAVAALERHGELELTEEVRARLCAISAATIDRRMAPERKRMQLRGRSATKPGSLLKSQIPIRTFADWDDLAPGFCEADLVVHDGGDPRGEFACTLDVTCVATGWTEVRILRNRAHRWTLEAFEDIAAALPMPLLGLDTDNGGEFINYDLYEFCADLEVSFTRARPYRKNDNCFVEQKNNSVVRRYVGYARYDTDAEREVLHELYGYLVDYVNHFQPQMRLVEKTRSGARVTKRFDTAATPFTRLMRSGVLDAEVTALLTKRHDALNPAELRRVIGRCQDRLLELARIPKVPHKGVAADHYWRTH
jgi:hypothetical protein